MVKTNLNSQILGFKETLANVSPSFVRCRREVIVSAGAVNSPWLLQLSGIGPAEVLRAANIPVVADLPVGENLLVIWIFGDVK